LNERVFDRGYAAAVAAAKQADKAYGEPAECPARTSDTA